MATLATERISVTLPSNVATLLRERAKRQNMTVSQTFAYIVEDAEDDEDEISDEEDKRLSALVDERIATATEFMTLEEFRKAVYAL